MKIAILCPTRERPKMAHQMLMSAKLTAHLSPSIYFYVDDDEPQWMAYSPLSDHAVLVHGPGEGVGKAWNALAAKAVNDGADMLMMANDDLVFKTQDWDERVAEAAAKYPDDIFCIWANDLINGKKQCCFPFVSPRWIEIQSYFVPEIFNFFYHDTWIEDIAKRLKRLEYLGDEVVIEHRHVSVGKMNPDGTTRRNRDRDQSRRDDVMFRDTKSMRHEIAGRFLSVLE